MGCEYIVKVRFRRRETPRGVRMGIYDPVPEACGKETEHIPMAQATRIHCGRFCPDHAAVVEEDGEQNLEALFKEAAKKEGVVIS